jgi:hypothetical protein
MTMTQSANYKPQTIEQQYDQCRKWVDLFRAAGYAVHFSYTDTPAPFDREWQVWPNNDAMHWRPLGSIDIDGSGASWHGDDALWLAIVGPSAGMTA